MPLRLRIFLLFLILIAGALAFTLYVVGSNVRAAGEQRVYDALNVGRKVFQDKTYSKIENFVKAAKIIGKEDGLRTAVFDDEYSLQISLGNFLRRLESEHMADLMWLLDIDGNIVGQAGVVSEEESFPHPDILDEAANEDWSLGVVVPLKNKLYELAVVGFFIPVSAPSPSFWIVIGRELGNEFTRELADLTNLNIYIIGLDQQRIWAQSSAVDLSLNNIEIAQLSSSEVVFPLFSENDSALALKTFLQSSSDHPIYALLLKSHREVQQQVENLMRRIVFIGFAALLISLVGAAILSRSITKPLLQLVKIAQKIGRGEYSGDLPTKIKGEVGTLSQVFTDMRSDIARRQQEIQHIAYHDMLTDLPNRNAFIQELSKAIDYACKNHTHFAICFFDFDRFKDINDTLGHQSGDLLLVSFANRMEKWRPENVKIARLGGDEFAVLVPDLSLLDDVVEQLEELAAQPIEIESIALEVRLSMGISMFPDHGERPNSLLQTAEIAMYIAKTESRDIVYYEKQLDHHSTQRLTLIAELRNAIENDQLSLNYQPKLDIQQDKYTHVECLVRWIHPRYGFINPEEFIGYAEQTGAIRDLTRWVVNTALTQCAQWREQGKDLKVAINISAVDLTQDNFSDWVMETLAEYKLPAEAIVLEVTESAVMRDIDKALAALHSLSQQGVSLSIDDYGTGYSSMAQLKCLPVDELKIDKSFVLSLIRDSDDYVIVKSTIELGHNMGLKIVAEGVENQQALDLLSELKCDLAQGFYLSRPLSKEKLDTWLLENAAKIVLLKL